MAISAERKQAAIDELRKLMQEEDHEHDHLCHKSGEMLGEFASAVGGELIGHARMTYMDAVTESKGRNNCYTRSSRHMMFLSMEIFMAFAEELMALETGDMGPKTHETLVMISKMPKDWMDIPTERVESLRGRAEAALTYFQEAQETMQIISEMDPKDILEAFKDVLPDATVKEFLEIQAQHKQEASNKFGDMINAIIKQVMGNTEITDDDVLIVKRDMHGNNVRLDRNGFPWAENMDKPI
jgi:hypothetical protein